MDSNHRPYAYQAYALTRLSYRPGVVRGDRLLASLAMSPRAPAVRAGNPHSQPDLDEQGEAPEDRGGGPDRVRTDDLLDANQALSQLSYGPNQTLLLPQRRFSASLKTGWIARTRP